MARKSVPEPQRARLLAAVRAAAKLPQAVRDAHTAGGSVREIAELSGRSTNTIQRWIREQR